MKEKTIELMVAGYEWVCPDCKAYNTCTGMEEQVSCIKCGKSYSVANSRDAIA